MLARAVRDSETQQLTWQRITGDSGAAGATPLGAILAIFSNTVPEGFLPCNGAAYDITTYTDLYELLGTSTLPDFRECSLVGIGENSTDTFTTPHDIYTLGQFKDGQSGGAVSAGYTVSGSNLVLNNDTTLGAENRKLVHQYVTNANATDLVTGSSITRGRSKGVNFVIKAIPGMETTEVTDALELINEKLALTLTVKGVDTLPTGADIGNYLYYYDYAYYVPTLNTSDPSLNYLTQLANFSDIQPVDAVTNGDMHPVTSNAVYDKLNAVEAITITPNSHVTSGIITCMKWGHYVEVNLQNVITDLTDGNTVFASGFPKPALNVRYNCFTVHAIGAGLIGSVNISQSGDMDTAWAEASQTVTYQGSFTYLSAD